MTTNVRSEPRKRPSQTRSRVTVDAICAAAVRVLKSEPRPSTRRIAQVAGVSIGTLYQYFQNREALLAELVRRQLDLMGAAMTEAIVKSHGQALAARVRAMVRAISAVKAEDPKLHQALAARLSSIEATPIVVSFKEAAVQAVHALLRSHADELRVKNLDMASRVVVDAVDGALFAEVLRGGARLSEVAFVDEVAAIAIRYLCR